MKVEYIDHMGNDKSIIKAARVSFANVGDEDRPPEKDTGLLRYLATHNHWTPFAHTAITVRMTAPVPIRTQCFKHKFGFVENEESRRYVSYTPEYFVPEFREAADNKKQGSGGLLSENYHIQGYYRKCVDKAIVAYEELLKCGVCEEQARFVLPQGCMVNWYWTGSLSAFARFYSQRSKPDAQVEIQQLAQQVDKIISPLFPEAWAFLIGEKS